MKEQKEARTSEKSETSKEQGESRKDETLLKRKGQSRGRADQCEQMSDKKRDNLRKKGPK